MSEPDTVLSPGIPGDGSPYSDTAVTAIYASILHACLAAGLGMPDSQDVAQDVWEWLLRMGSPVLALTAPWLGAVVHNHVLRYRRRTAKLRAREGICIEAVPEPGKMLDTSGLESNEMLDRIASVLPSTERNLLVLIRRGFTLAKAAQILGIPRGSRAYHGGRLIALAREGIARKLTSRRPRPRETGRGPRLPPRSRST